MWSHHGRCGYVWCGFFGYPAETLIFRRISKLLQLLSGTDCMSVRRSRTNYIRRSHILCGLALQVGEVLKSKLGNISRQLLGRLFSKAPLNC